MPATEAMIGYGSRFSTESAPGSGIYLDFPEVTNITPPSDTIAMIDASHMQSPNKTREFISGMNDPGECKFSINFVPGTGADAKIQQIRAAKARVSNRITFPNGVAWTFDALLQNYTPSVPTEEKMTAEVSWKVTGSYVTAPAAAPVNGILPATSGVPRVGQVLRSWAGGWSNAPIFTFQWKKNGVDIAGATAETYTPVAGDLGAAISVAVTGTNSAGSATAVSAASANVIAA